MGVANSDTGSRRVNLILPFSLFHQYTSLAVLYAAMWTPLSVMFQNILDS